MPCFCIVCLFVFAFFLLVCVCVCFLLWNIFFLLLSILLSYKQVIEFVTKTCHCGFVTEMSFMISYNGFNDLHVWKKSSE
jgi:1,4-dihydroxy-2-naphthoate octaprenyltransferase